MLSQPNEAASSKAVNENANTASRADANKSSASAADKVKVTPSADFQDKLSTDDKPSSTTNQEVSNLKLPTFSSSSSEDTYDLFSPPVSTNVRSRSMNMTVVTAADSVLKDQEGMVFPPFRGDMVSFALSILFLLSNLTIRVSEVHGLTCNFYFIHFINTANQATSHQHSHTSNRKEAATAL